MRISAALLTWNWKLAQTRARRLTVPRGAAEVAYMSEAKHFLSRAG